MKKIYILCIAFGWFQVSQGQVPGRWQLGLQVGGGHTFGDLVNSTQPDWPVYQSFDAEESPWALRAHIGWRFAPAWTWSLSGDYGHLLSSDRTRDWRGDLRVEDPNFTRALNARTELMSLHSSLRLHLANDQILDLDAGWDPYAEVGIGWLQFTPFGDLLDAAGQPYHYWADGSLRDRAETAPNAGEAQLVERDRKYETRLSDLQTNQKADYAQQSLIIPVGLGIRRRLGEGVWLTGNVRWTYTFTDYLDDASGSFPEASDIPLENFAINPGGVNPNNFQRGTPDNLDSYVFLGIGLELELGDIGKTFKGHSLYAMEEWTSQSVDTSFVRQQEIPEPKKGQVEALEVPLDEMEASSPETEAMASVVIEEPLPDSVELIPLPIVGREEANREMRLQHALEEEARLEKAFAEAIEAKKKAEAARAIGESDSSSIDSPLVLIRGMEIDFSSEYARGLLDSLRTLIDSIEHVNSTAKPPQSDTVVIRQQIVPESTPTSPNPMADSVAAIRGELLRFQVGQESAQRERLEAELAILQAQNDSLKAIVEAQRAIDRKIAIREAEARVRAEQAYESNRAIDEILEKTAVPDMPTSAVPVAMPSDSTNTPDSVIAPLTINAATSDRLEAIPDSSRADTDGINIQIGQGNSAGLSPAPVVNPPMVLPARPGTRDTLVIQSEPAIIQRDTVVVYVPSKPDTIEKIIPVLAEQPPTMLGLARTSIHFDLGKTTYHPADTLVLKQVLEVLSARPETDLKLEGYTDKRGSAELNMRLSRQRAEGVAAYFTNGGIDPSRIHIHYVGESQTRYADGALDRRVDISIVSRAEGK